jgi:hypothetical protein
VGRPIIYIYIRRLEGIYARDFITFGALDDTIEHEHVSVGVGLEDEHVLIQRLFDVEDLDHLETRRLAGPKDLLLSEPAIFEI